MIDYLHGVEQTPLRKLLFTGALAGGKEVEDTATGNPLTFVTDLARPLKSLVASFTPVQAGTGDPSPENVRPISGMGGVRVCQLPQNLLSINRSGSQETQGITYTVIKDGNNKAVAIHVEGTRTSTNPFFNLNYVNGTTISIPVGEYKMYGGVPGCRAQVFYKDENGVERIGGQDYGEGTAVTVPEGATASWMRLLVDTDNPVDFVVYPVLIGSSDAYAEFSVEFPALGKNLLDPSTLEQGGIDSYGSETYNLKRIRSSYITVEEGKKYTLSAGTGKKCFLHFYGSDYESIGANTLPSITAPTGAAFVRCIIGYESEENITPSDVTQWQLEQAASATTYEPFTNTIYGGTLDLVSGVLTATLACDTLKWGDAVVSADLTNVKRRVFALSHDVKNVSTKDGKYCDKARFLNDYTSDTVHFYTAVASGLSRAYVFLPIGTEETETVQVVYPLATPVTFQLTPQQVTALIGNNTMWADADSMSVTYLKKG